MISFAALRPAVVAGLTGALGLALVLGACGKSSDPPAADAGSPPGGDPQAEIGGFDVQLVAAVAATSETAAVPAQTAFLGAVRSGAAPELKTWSITAEEGPCRLEEPRIPFCNPACSESVCTQQGCVRDPGPRSAGTLTLKGAMVEGGGTTLIVPPEPPRFIYQLPSGVRLAYPPAAPGAEIELGGQGGDLGTFSLRARGISPLVIPAGGVPVVRPGMPFPLRWDPGQPAEQARIQILIDLSFHAGTKGRIQCDVADSGSLQIGSAMMMKLLALGTAGFPKVVLTRSSVGTATVAGGRVKLTVFAELLHTLMIEGQTSCTEDKDCPAGQTCSPSFLCQ